MSPAFTQPTVEAVIEALRKEAFSEAESLALTLKEQQGPLYRVLMVLGLAKQALDKLDEAAAVFKEGTALYPDKENMWFNLADIEAKRRRFSEAEACFRKTLDLAPARGGVHGNLSNLYRKMARFPEAEEEARQALAKGVPQDEGINTLAVAVSRQYRFEEADKLWEKAISLSPNKPVFWSNRANNAVDSLAFDKAWDFFAKARSLEDRPSFRRDEGMARLLTGDYAKGWELYEARLLVKKAFLPPPGVPPYRGEPMDGKTILLLSEQGLGDALQFCRFGEKILERGGNLIWGLRPPLRRILRPFLKGDFLKDDADFSRADSYIPLLSLPYALGALEPETWRTDPYIEAPRHLDLPLGPGEEAREKIGLVWRGSPTHQRDFERSISLRMLAPLWQAKPDALFFAPFLGDGLDEIASLEAPVRKLDWIISDFADTASLLRELDALVTVDTSLAHLAGAMGIKTFLLLPRLPDWRWGIESEKTAWYDSLTLLRQKAHGDWGSVVRDLLERLK